jgi:hypothetical protein
MGFVYSEASDVDVSDDGNSIFSPAKQKYWYVTGNTCISLFWKLKFHWAEKVKFWVELDSLELKIWTGWSVIRGMLEFNNTEKNLHTFSASVLLSSVGPWGQQLYTFRLRWRRSRFFRKLHTGDRSYTKAYCLPVCYSWAIWLIGKSWLRLILIIITSINVKGKATSQAFEFTCQRRAECAHLNFKIPADKR